MGNSHFPELINERDDERETALTSAARLADKDTVQFLIEKVGINPTETGFQGRNCFLSAASGGKIETLKYLNLKYPELKNGQDRYGRRALDLASDEGVKS